MHRLFADWYRQADLNPSAEVLNARWKCVETAVAKIDAVSILKIARVCFGLPTPDADASDSDAVAMHFKEADVSFPMKGNEQLLRVLFGVTLAQYIETPHNYSTLAALAVVCARCFGIGTLPVIEELVPIAEQYLVAQGEAKRSSGLEDPVVPPKFGKLEVGQPGTVELVEMPGAGNWNLLQQNIQRLGAWVVQVNSAVETLTSGLSNTRSEATAAFKANADRVMLESRISVLKEECDVLWWLFGEYSDASQKGWSEASASEMCFVLGRELSGLMVFYAPAPNARSFLARALAKTVSAETDITAKQLLDAGTEAWRKAATGAVRETTRITAGLTPLHTGLVYRTDASPRWTELLARTTALKSEHQLAPVRWAEQVYREALLLSAVEGARG